MNSFFTSQFNHYPLVWMFHSRTINNKINYVHDDVCAYCTVIKRHASEFSVPNVKSIFHGTESLAYLGPKIWDLVPKELKELSSLSAFKKTIKKCVTNTFRTLVSFDTFSDIVDFLNMYV